MSDSSNSGLKRALNVAANLDREQQRRGPQGALRAEMYASIAGDVNPHEPTTLAADRTAVNESGSVGRLPPTAAEGSEAAAMDASRGGPLVVPDDSDDPTPIYVRARRKANKALAVLEDVALHAPRAGDRTRAAEALVKAAVPPDAPQHAPMLEAHVSDPQRPRLSLEEAREALRLRRPSNRRTDVAIAVPDDVEDEEAP